MAFIEPLADVGATPRTFTPMEAVGALGGGGNTAFPDNATDGFDARFVWKTRLALIAPIADGENVTVTVHASTATVVGQPFEIMNEAAFVPESATFVIESGAVPEFEISTICEELAVPTRWFPNARLAADNATNGSGVDAFDPDPPLPPPPQADSAEIIAQVVNRRRRIAHTPSDLYSLSHNSDENAQRHPLCRSLFFD